MSDQRGVRGSFGDYEERVTAEGTTDGVRWLVYRVGERLPGGGVDWFDWGYDIDGDTTEGLETEAEAIAEAQAMARAAGDGTAATQG